MKINRDLKMLLVLTVVLGVVAPFGFAQRRMGGGKGWPKYDPST